MDAAATFIVIAATAVTNSHRNACAATNTEAQAVVAEHIVADGHLFAGAHLAPTGHVAGDLYRLMGDVTEVAAFQQHFVGLEEDTSGSGAFDAAVPHQCIGAECGISQHIAGLQIAVYVCNIHAIDFITGYAEGTLLPEVILPIDSDHIAGLRPVSRQRQANRAQPVTKRAGQMVAIHTGNDCAGGVHIQRIIAKIFKNAVFNDQLSAKSGNVNAISIGGIDALGAGRQTDSEAPEGKIPASGINGATLTGRRLHRNILQQHIGAVTEGHLIGRI